MAGLSASWATEAGQQVNTGNAAPISDAELRDFMTTVAAKSDLVF
jgi:hypothetical protein